MNMEIRPRQGEDAFSHQYQAYGGMLYRVAMAWTGREQDAEDVMQEAFIRLLYRAPHFRDEEHEKRWLLRVTINLCKNLRKSGWQSHQEPLGETELPSLDAGQRELFQLVLALPDTYKAAICLYYIAGYSVGEIAALLHVTPSAVKMRLQRGREKLRIAWEAPVEEAGPDGGRSLPVPLKHE